MIAEGQVGIQILNDGANQAVRLTKLAALVAQQLHGKYYEQSYRGNSFLASMQAAAALSTLSTTATGLILYNPAGSGKNLVVIDLCVATATAPATTAATIGLAANVNINAAAVTGTALITRCTLIGSGAASVATAFSSATLPVAPVMIRAIGGGTLTTGAVHTSFNRDEISASLIVGPGCAISLSYLTTAISVLASICWEEVSI